MQFDKMNCTILKPYGRFPLFLTVTLNSFLSLNPITVIAAHRRKIAEPAGFFLLGRIHAELSGTHVIEKLPNLRDHFVTNLLPLVISDHAAYPAADSGILHRAEAMKSLVPPFVTTTNDVVAAARDR